MDERRLNRATALLVVLIALAVVLSGLPFWSRRVGLIDRQAYGQDLTRFCVSPLQPIWLPATCRPHRLLPGHRPAQWERIDSQRLYQASRPEMALRALRVLLLPLLFGASLALVCSDASPKPTPQALLALLPLLLSTLTSLLISLPIDGPMATLLSGVGRIWLPLAAVAGWLTTPRRLVILADGAAALVLLQLPFLLLEAMRGLPVPFGGSPSAWLPTRLSGLMTMPNTLGGLLAVSVAFCFCLSPRRWQRWPLFALALLLSVLARSGTGVVSLGLLAVLGLARDLRFRRRQGLALVLALVLLTPLLPRLLGRPQLFASPAGRVRTLRIWLQNPRSAAESWLGYGLASNNQERHRLSIAPRLQRGPSADGMPTLLLAQGGLLALLAFYGLIGWCAWLDPGLRPFWLVLAVTSLTLRLSEVLPISIWMAVATARALAQGGGRGDGGWRRRLGR